MKKTKTEKEPQGDKKQSLESGRGGEGEREEITERKEESSSNSTSLVCLLRCKFQLEPKKKSKTGADFLKERPKIRGKRELKG